MSTIYDPRPWMKRTLFVAGIYNLIWGAICVIAPVTMLSFVGIATDSVGAQFWQCIGMIVGVYGIGYVLAAGAPFRHWPITLVGLLGKVFGPIGFLAAVLDGSLPARMGWIILANDLIWWIPFTVILWGAVRHHHTVGSAYEMPEDDDPLRDVRSNTGARLDVLADASPQMVVFLRHSGCTFCRQALSDISKQRQKIEAAGGACEVVDRIPKTGPRAL